MIIILIIGLIIFIISLIAHIMDKKDVSFNLGVLGTWIMFGAIVAMSINKKPSAMDVNKGKNYLEITYKNNIPIDSVVVFKNK